MFWHIHRIPVNDRVRGRITEPLESTTCLSEVYETIGWLCCVKMSGHE